jgi:hypothetical protein
LPGDIFALLKLTGQFHDGGFTGTNDAVFRTGKLQKMLGTE